MELFVEGIHFLVRRDDGTGASWILEKSDSSHSWKRLSDPTSD